MSHDFDPTDDGDRDVYDGNVWVRGIHMIIFACLFWVARVVLGVVALIQFLWMLFSQGERNRDVAAFGASLGEWLREVAQFQSGANDEKPFPWRPWTDRI